MSQVSVAPRTARGRSSWHALRPLLVLGGFVAIWWALMTGVAHADDAQRHSVLDQVRSNAKAHHATPAKDPVGKLVRKVQHTAQAHSSQVTTHVRQHTEPVTREVTSAVHATPVVGEVTKATTATVSETVTKTRDVLGKTLVGPVVDPVLKPVDEVVTTTPQKPESSTGQGNSPSKSTSGPSTATSFAQQLPIAFETGGPGSATSTGTDTAEPSQDGGSPLGDPSAPGPCASPSGSGSTSSTPVGTLESSWLEVPSVLRDHHTWRLARLPGGPAYEPGSSPD